MVYQIVNCRGRVCLPEPAVTTLGVIHKASCFRAREPRPYGDDAVILPVGAREPRPYGENDSIIHVLAYPSFIIEHHESADWMLSIDRFIFRY